jgi:2-polyprenyl-3-methyl-5-hydroxy-6-metoxy-1,4-benzoquinol methylase
MQLASLSAGDKVVDLGCGRGEVTLACLKAGCEVWALDFSEAALEFTHKTVGTHAPDSSHQLHLLRSDAVDAFLEEGLFDCVISTDVVEHIDRDRLHLVVQNVHRSLKSGGRFVVHTSPTLGYMYFGQFVARMMEVVQRKPISRIETFKTQLQEGGHCNIQSVRRLRRYLDAFLGRKVWAEFSIDSGMTKAVLNRLGLTPALAHHIFAMAWK